MTDPVDYVFRATGVVDWLEAEGLDDRADNVRGLIDYVRRLRDTVAERDAEIDTLRAMIAEEDK